MRIAEQSLMRFMAHPETHENIKKLVQVEAGWTPPVPGFSPAIPAEAGIHLGFLRIIFEAVGMGI